MATRTQTHIRALIRTHALAHGLGLGLVLGLVRRCLCQHRHTNAHTLTPRAAPVEAVCQAIDPEYIHTPTCTRKRPTARDVIACADESLNG